MIHNISPGDSTQLQSAITTSQPGDEIILPAGARYVGTFVLPPKAGKVTLRGPVFPARRVTPADAAGMPTIASGSSGRAIEGTGAKNWDIWAVRFEPNAGGFGEVLGFENAENIVLECILLVVPEGQQQKRGVLGNGRNITLTRSHLAGIWRDGQDSQAFAAWDGPGPYTLTDNYLEAASENILFGGADSSSAANIPADILLEGNHITKPARWKGDGVSEGVKNLFELKAGKRIVVRRNLFEGNWGGEGQSGTAIVFTPVNQGTTAPWTVIEDVQFYENTIRDTDMGISVVGYGYRYPNVIPVQGGPTRQTTRIVFRDNLIECKNRAFYFGGEVGAVQAYRNRVVLQGGSVVMSLDKDGRVWPEGQAERAPAFAVSELTWAENVTPAESYIHSATALNDAALKAYVQTQPVVRTVPDGSVPVPETPPVIDGPPEPLPGDVVGPSVPPDPTLDVMEQFNVDLTRVEDELLSTKAELAKVKLDLGRLVAYLQATPKVSRIEQLRSYLRGVGK